MDVVIYRELSCIVGLFFLSLFLFLNKGMDAFLKKAFAVLVLLEVVIIISTEMESILAGSPAQTRLRIFFSIIGYSLRPALFAVFGIIRNRDMLNRRERILFLMPAYINFVFVSTAWFSPVVFGYSPDNYFIRGPFGFVPYFPFGVYLLLFLFLFIRESHSSGKAFSPEDWLMLGIVTYICSCLYLDYQDPALNYNHMNNAFMICTVSYYIYFLTYGLYTDLQQERKTKQRMEEENRIAIMVSQIQPHFIYNALNSICFLIQSDPALAEDTLIDFSRFLRANLDSLNQKDPIPFSEVFDHVNIYLHLEQLRFRNKLRIVYDIACRDFSLPPLTLQPIAENAVRHGVIKRPQGGTVTIATRKEDSKYIVTISDDGVGFDPSQPPPEDGRSHIGVENVRKRIESISHGSMHIQSQLGKGTVVTIEIPGGSEVCKS